MKVKEKAKEKDIIKYNEYIKHVRKYFQEKNYIEVPEIVHTITTSCEGDPKNVILCKKNGMMSALPQSNLKWIQHLLHKFNHNGGIFMTGTSYDQQQSIHPIIDFASYGTFADLLELLDDFCKYMGFENIIHYYPMDVNILNDNECEKFQDNKCIITTGLDKMFGKYHWFYKLVDKNYQIASIIIRGKRVLVGGERHTDVNKVMYNIYTIDNGEYIDILYNLFSKKRVDDELFKYSHINLITRFGATLNLDALFEILN